MKVRAVFLVMLIISMALLSGCQKAETAQTQATQAEGSDAAVSSGPGGDAPNPELDDLSRLTLGTFKLEGSDNAVTPEQAAKLLPLWKLLQGGTLTRDEETNAVIKQIEGQMTEAQLAAIDAMGLTFEDERTWMQEQGIEMPAPTGGWSDGQGTPSAPGNNPNLTEEERAQMRDQFQNMTPEERATAMAESGFQRPQGAPDGQAPGGGRQFGGGFRGGNVMLEPLIKLLTERAAQ
ncbi:MAG: hypothetical protein JXR84_20500 [Anaerolineae bacterium]|nr:hypothetical protein [Anaerolineae bacterium]